MEGVLKDHGVLFVGAQAAHAPFEDLGAVLSLTDLLAGEDAPEVSVDPGAAQGGLGQMAVRGGGHIHPHALHFQQGEEFHNAGLGLDLVGVEVLHLGLDQGDDLVHTLGHVVGVLAVGGALADGQDLELLAQVRLRLDAQGAQGPGAQVVPDEHGVEQSAVHVENRALQSHHDVPFSLVFSIATIIAL